MSESTRTEMCVHGPQNAEVPDKSDTDSASEILDRRYALGEIERKEYEEKKRTLDRQGVDD